jgi:hypothetical protein
MLGERKNVDLFKYVKLNEDDFKISFKELEDLEDIAEGASAFVFKGIYNGKNIALKTFKIGYKNFIY